MTSRNKMIFGSKPTMHKFLLIISFFVYIGSINMTDLSEKTSIFATKLYNELVLEKPNENIIISPFSTEACIAMARIGAQGQTANEIDQSLQLGTSDVTEIAEMFKPHLQNFKNAPYINIANRIYVTSDYIIENNFNDILSNQFYSDAKEINFAESTEAANEINNWVKTETNNQIQDFISSDSLDINTRLVLINAIHFKADWKKKFFKHKTKSDYFYLNEHDHVNVSMMLGNGWYQYGRIPELDAVALELTYSEDSGCSMLIILPNSRTGLENVEAKLKEMPLSDILSKMKRERVVIRMPKFKAEFSIELNEPLNKLGMKTMFTDMADFRKMSETSEILRISKVIHKAYINVNEEGTEATAASAKVATMMRVAGVARLYANHPFLYIIKSKEDIILFMGKKIK